MLDCERLTRAEQCEQRLVDLLRGLAVRYWVCAHDLGDLGQRVRRPQVDRVEQRPGDEERDLVEQLVVVVPGVPVARGEERTGRVSETRASG